MPGKDGKSGPPGPPGKKDMKAVDNRKHDFADYTMFSASTQLLGRYVHLHSR